MKNLLIVFLALSIFGCATGHDQWIRDQRRIYSKMCKKWYETKGKKLTERVPGEETLSVSSVIRNRIKENPDIMDSVPQKQDELRSLEYMWGENPTLDSCAGEDFYNE